MPTPITNPVASAIAACLLFAPASAATPVLEYDMRPRLAGGGLLTVDAYNDDLGTLISNVHTFGYEFGEDPEDPYFIQDPGIDVEPGSELTPGTTLRFDVLRGLRYWSGAGTSVQFTAPPSNEALRLSFGAQQTTIDSTDVARGGFTIGTLDGAGALHRHLNAFLLGADGNAVAGDGVEAAPGLYYTNIVLANDGPQSPRSRPLFLVYNNGLAEASFEAALDFLDGLLPGDSDANGVIDFDDYVRIDSGFNNALSGMANGDCNGDGIIDFDDYVLIDQSFNTQRPGLAGMSAVPEPAGALGALGGSLVVGWRSGSRRSRLRRHLTLA